MSLMRGTVANILDAVGNTPLVKLNKIGNHTDAEIYVKCEYMNPGGSMKDRIAINIINDAEKAGLIKPGGTIVEATSGNTGMGLALVAAVRGYKCIFVMPDKMSLEKIKALRAVGAKVVICPTNVEAEDPRSYYCVSRRIADETPGAFYANQYHNPSNPGAHYRSTGPELWAQTGGDFDALCAGMGTGGTLSGTGKYLKEQNPKIQIVGVDPVGSLYYDMVKTGRLTQAHPYKVEGIGEDFMPSTMDLKILDEIIRVTDKECFDVARRLAREEGILCGGSGGASVVGAVKYAEMIGKRVKIIAHLPDTALRYLSKYLDDDWMRENGFLGPEPGLGTVRDLLRKRGNPSPIVAEHNETVGIVISRMRENGISQIPILRAGQVLGVITERKLLNELVTQHVKLDALAGTLADGNFAAVDFNTPIATLSSIINQHVQVGLVIDNGVLKGIVTQIDLIACMADKLS